VAVREAGQGTAVRGAGAEALVRAARENGVTDPRLFDAIRTTPRAAFVPPEQRKHAYMDAPLPIPRGQVATQPSLVVTMLDALELTGAENVLEVGTGYGWQTALLSKLAGRVWSIERHHDLAEAAAGALAGEEIRGVRVVVGDGSRGLPARAPYHAIVVSAAYPRVPGPLARQLALGGRLVQPIGEGGQEDVVLFERTENGLERRRSLTGAHFVPLVGRHGFKAETG
jgi:protein-L-isoaspartate(D-aspartate) O-methyltransferase